MMRPSEAWLVTLCAANVCAGAWWAASRGGRHEADAERQVDWSGGLETTIVVIDDCTTFGKLAYSEKLRKLAYSEKLLTDLFFILIDA